MTAYYNEIDPKAAAWLRELIKQGHIADGVVDERSIEDVLPADLVGFAQCHFFAGIGGWSYALRLAGWPDDKPVWTGSCPCQPFSAAGKGAGFADERHLWPTFFHLISQCRPAIVFGEQVATALDWLDLVQTDMEATGYAFGAADLCAASVGAPHIRQRLYWVGHSIGSGLERYGRHGNGSRQPGRIETQQAGSVATPGAVGGMADSYSNRQQPSAWRSGSGEHAEARNDTGRGGAAGFWSNADWLPCRDEKWRPVEPGTFPLANGVPARVGRLRGYGNAIVPQVAAAFIEATT